MNDQTLYASVTQSSIVVSKDKILYIDGSNSIDILNPNYLNVNFIWQLKGYPQLTFDNTKILTLLPD